MCVCVCLFVVHFTITAYVCRAYIILENYAGWLVLSHQPNFFTGWIGKHACERGVSLGKQSNSPVYSAVMHFCL